MSTAATYFLLSLFTLQIADGTGEQGYIVETFDTKYVSETSCLEAVELLRPITEPSQTYACDPGGPDIPTQMELASGE